MAFTVLITTRSFGREVRAPLERLQREGCRILEWREGSGRPEAELREKVAQADAWIVAFHPIDAGVLAAARRLRLIAKHGVGVDNIDVAAATARGVAVTIAPGANDAAVADHALALLLALLRRVPDADASVKAGRWERFLGVGLAGKTLGILGLGRIGLGVARRASGFGVALAGCDPVWPEQARELRIRRLEREVLLGAVDVLSLHLPLTVETEGLIGARELSVMKDGAVIVNTSRGRIVQEKALYEALVGGKIAGYATDVFEREPPAGSPLLQLPTVVATPHIGAHTREALGLMGDCCAEAVLRVRSGQRPGFVVNPEVYRQDDGLQSPLAPV